MKKDNEYKELKIPEEMTKTERKKNNISDYVEEGSNGTFSLYEFMYALLGAVGYAFFTFLFGIAGISFLLGEVEDSTTRLVCAIFGIASIFIGYKCIMYIKDIVNMFKKTKKKNSFVITVGGLGYTCIGLAFISLIVFLVIGLLTDSEFAVWFLNNSIFIVGGISLLGAILIYIDVYLDSAHKNNVIIGKRKY